MSAHRTRFLAGLAIFFSIIAVGQIANAQLPSSISGIELSVSNESPAPGQNVTITARSFSADINSATLTWTVNGKVAQKGVGLTTFSLNAPDLGKKTTLNVSMTVSDGQQFQKNITITSGSVDMVIETDGYTPPFYLGKVEAAYQNRVKVVAVPHLYNSSGVEYDPKTLVYTWKKSDRVIENQSGYGKQALLLDGELVPRPYFVTVDVKSRDNAVQAKGIISITPQAPTIEFYIDDPLYGPFFNRAIQNRIRIGSENELRILGVPFGFNKPMVGLGNLSFNWSINGRGRSELSENQSVVLRAPENTAGTANVALDVRHSTNILQGTRGGFTVEFRERTNVADNSITF